MTQIHALEPIPLRQAWEHEALKFTPWLADNLHLLNKELNLSLELVQQEMTLPQAGRLDILAQQVTSKANLVIENQLTPSDDDHCFRLIGYAATADANILIWIAESFSDYHRNIVSWLNDTDAIHVYAVEIRAYRVGDATAAQFRLIAGPARSQPATPSPANASSYYATFYRPVVQELRRSGLPPIGRGGWRGRWRSFEAGHTAAVYAAGLSDGHAWAFVSVSGAENQHIFDALAGHRSEIDAHLDQHTEWHQSTDESWFGLRTQADINDPMLNLDATTDWITGNLLRLKSIVQPHLDQIITGSEAPNGNNDSE